MTPSFFECFLAFWYNKLFQAYLVLSPTQHQKRPFISPRSPSSKIWRQEVLLIPGHLSIHTHACVCAHTKRYPPLPSSLALAIPSHLSTWTPSSFCLAKPLPRGDALLLMPGHHPHPHHHILFTLHKLWYPAPAYPSARMPFHLPQALTLHAFPTQRWFTTPSCLFPGIPSSSSYLGSGTLFWSAAASLPLMALAQNCSGRTRIKALLKFYGIALQEKC